MKITMEKQFKPDLEVLARFAEAYRQNSSMKKTHLHLSSKVRWDSFVRYLSWLESSNYIECQIDGEGERYLLTENGREMLGILLRFLECVESNRPIATLSV